MIAEKWKSEKWKSEKWIRVYITLKLLVNSLNSMEGTKDVENLNLSTDLDNCISEEIMQEIKNMARDFKEFSFVLRKLLFNSDELMELCKCIIIHLENAPGTTTSRNSPLPKRANEDKDMSPLEMEVKTCAVEGCGYVQKRTNNNMRHHYLAYHEDTTYPVHPFSVVSMDVEVFEKLLKFWKDSCSGKEHLRRQTPLRNSTSSKRRCLE